MVAKSRGLSFPRRHQRLARFTKEPDALESRGARRSEVDSIAGTYESPETVHADRELQTLVRQAVSRLGKTAGEMFVLRYYEGFDNKDIATIMNTSPLVVGVVLHRARTKLKKEIGHYLEKHHEE